MKVIILTGLPGSGKSTWAKEYCAKNKDWVRINRDDLRNMRGDYWLPKQEDLITKWERHCVDIALNAGYNVVIDATHLNPKYIQQWKDFLAIFVADHGLVIEIKSFETPIEECIKRDLKRPNSVGEKVIREMYNKHLKPKVEPITQNNTLPKTIIIDLDGTLCIHNGRGPFEYDKCNTDLPNRVVVDIVKKYFGYSIIFLSGREDSSWDKTAAWLIKELSLNLNHDMVRLFMRKAGDMRKDCIIKKEIFDAHIKDKYFVEFVLDDRNQVVAMWRELGLTCLQVAEGDF